MKTKKTIARLFSGAIVAALVLSGTLVPSAVATHESNTEDQCATNANGENVICVSATRDPNPMNDGRWTGWCGASTDTGGAGELDCDDTNGRHNGCSWEMEEESCDTPNFPYGVSEDIYSVTATGCSGIKFGEEIVIHLPTGQTIEVDGTLTDDGWICLTVVAGPSDDADIDFDIF